jgi:hypothetical protein
VDGNDLHAVAVIGATTRSVTAAAAAVLVGLLLASCGGGNDLASPPPPQDVPPLPVAAELPPPPVFGTLAPVGRAAQDTVRAVLARIDTPTVMHDALAPASSLDWVEDGVCWAGPDSVATLVYAACETDVGWDWAVTVDPDALLADGETDATGRSGAFQSYGPPDDVVAWTWLATASRDSVEWSYARAGETVAMHWSRDDEGANLWLWTWPGESLIGYRISAARTVGWCETYDWSAGPWILRREIAWDGGHGHWLEFDAAGEEISRESW